MKLEWVESSAMFLTRHMMLFFVPLLAVAGAIMPTLSASWIAAADGSRSGRQRS
ncbi:CidA/LrgA family protein [Paenibacillus sp. R14(2021)]|uniref:CidA/LrgA family protein n=1 Tax=Paenibacillus sp. R14(2021) TaxID=2859228 RepID=UPI00215704B7|nr:CidA/LrgA family protein [Paenibacillus sp. R14(2021)]